MNLRMEQPHKVTAGKASHENLVRASDAPASDTLLHPLVGSTSSREEHLVNPVMPGEAVTVLCRELLGRNVGLILAILAALEQIGDERALPAVERLAEGRGAGRKPDVRRAAEECLPALHEHIGRSQSAQGLL